jgi:hypothetical protein
MSMKPKTETKRPQISSIAFGRWVAILFFAFAIISVGVWFTYTTVSAWDAKTSAKVSCSMPVDPQVPFSYIQYNIKDQAIEPFFRGSFFINLGNHPNAPRRVDVRTTGGRTYANTTTTAEFVRDEENQQFWMRKESDEVIFVRMSGSHRDFPF